MNAQEKKPVKKRIFLLAGAGLLFAFFAAVAICSSAALNQSQTLSLFRTIAIYSLFLGLLLLLVFAAICLTSKMKSKLPAILLSLLAAVAMVFALATTENSLDSALAGLGRWGKLGGTWQVTTHIYNFASGTTSEPFVATLELNPKTKTYTLKWQDAEYTGPAEVYGYSFDLYHPDQSSFIQAEYTFDPDKDTLMLESLIKDSPNGFLFAAVENVTDTGDSLVVESRVVPWSRVA